MFLFVCLLLFFLFFLFFFLGGGGGFQWKSPLQFFVMHHENKPAPIAQMVERPLREREVVGSIPGRAKPKALKMVPVATLLGAQHYKASTGSPLTHY